MHFTMQWEGALKRKLKDTDPYMNLSYKVSVDDPTDQIVRYAEKSDINSIAMSSRKIRTIVRAIQRIVRKVIDDIRKPVLVIHE